MRLHRTAYIRDDKNSSTRLAEWTASQAAAATLRKQLRSSGMRNIETVEVEVPTDKQGLMKFLNELTNA